MSASDSRSAPGDAGRQGEGASLERVEERTRHWIETWVIGQGLCPFARAPFEAGRVAIVASDARDEQGLLDVLDAEMTRLVATPRAALETTIVVHPHAGVDFERYLDLIELAEARLAARDLEGVLQIASFHPRYRFAGAPADDPAHASNRSPWPMTHLLREESVSEAVASHPDAEAIPAKNVARLRALGWAGIEAVLRGGD